MKLRFSVGDHVAVNLQHEGRLNQKFFGTVRKIEITDKGVTYYVQFHPDLTWQLFQDKELTPIYVQLNPPQAVAVAEDFQ